MQILRAIRLRVPHAGGPLRCRDALRSPIQHLRVHVRLQLRFVNIYCVCVSNGLHIFLLTFFRLDAPDLRPHLGLRSRLPTHHALRSLLSRHEAPRRQVADTIFLSMQRCPCKSVTCCQTV